MGATSVSGRRARRHAAEPGAHAASQRRAISPAEAAWLALVPCALATLAAILLLAPPLGRALFPPRRYDFWPSLAPVIAPEPTEHAAFLLALAGVCALIGAVLASARRPLALPSARADRLVRVAEAALCAFLGVALVAQHADVYEARYTLGPARRFPYFSWPTIAVALLLAAAVPLALRSAAWRARLAAALRETPRRRAAALLAAALFLVAWLLTAINVDSSVGNVNRAVFDMLPWSLDETYAVLDGRAPLVDFHAQYGQLWPYVAAGALALIGPSLAAYTAVMATIAGASLLAVFAILRRLARSSLAALALFLPLVATGFFMERGPLGNRYGPSNLFTIFPIRYAGPYLLAWLLSRRLDGRRPHSAWALFLGAGLVVLNNPEFGAPAAAATLVACVWTAPPRSAHAAARLLGEVVAGLAGAAAVVALVTLAQSGSLPHLRLLLEFARLYGVSGWAMLPMKPLGFHLVVFATFVAALALATVRAAARERDALLTGMLAWSGVFGLSAGVLLRRPLAP